MENNIKNNQNDDLISNQSNDNIINPPNPRKNLFKIPENTPCSEPECKHIATQILTESGFALAHGMYTYKCKCCLLKTKITYAKQCADSLSNLEKELSEVVCK